MYEGGGGRGGGEGGGEGWKISRFRPRWYTIFFMGCDFFSLVVQALGGGIAASVPLTNTTMVSGVFFVFFFHFHTSISLVRRSRQ